METNGYAHKLRKRYKRWLETEGNLGDWRDCGDQWICTQVKKGMRASDSWRLRATWETGEAVLRTVDIHTSEEKGTKDSWRLRETKETGETVETNGHGH